ncbi:MAG TPA: phosphate ABC transporter permease subunit PstC [Streptosporangiaceae bacterium]|nr:phosphate ABC transporter permease subunit PstC [Streptosporangiaceae bacterium]
MRIGEPSVLPARTGAVPRKLSARLSTSDLAFRAIARGGGVVVLVLLGLVGTFLFYRASQALHKAGWSFLTAQTWNPDGGGFGIAAVIVGTVLIALVAVVVAIPLSLGTALYISEYAPRSIQRFLVGIVDLMAAVPSVVYGLWGFELLQWRVVSLSRWINDWFGWIPIFKVDGVERNATQPTATYYTSSTFIAGIVVGLMITPIACSIMREAFSQAPQGEREGAYALGATRWGMIRAVVLPFGVGAMIGGSMLGLGRALGETIAVALIISPVYAIQPHILQHGTSSISSLIALRYAEATPFAVSALMAAGLALFALTLVVNVIAAVIVSRSRSGSVSEA